MSSSRTRLLASLINESNRVKSSLAPASLDAGNVTTYSSIDSLPLTGNTNGDQALITSTNTLYIFSNGWYKIALINSTPYWSTEAASSYSLSTTGASTVITILATDSEGIPITYTATTDSDFNQIATVTKDSDNGRTFTIVPFDSENGLAVAGSGVITFKASDGVNLVSTLSTFNLTFGPDWSATPTETILTNPVVIAGGYTYTNPQFGIDASISADGNYAAVGARQEFANNSNWGGAVYIYARSGSTWTQQARLVGSTVSTDYRFGSSLALNSDGTYIVIGAYSKNYNVGTAYVFTRSGSTWTQQAEIPSPTATADLFGLRSAIDSSGNLVAICAQSNPGASGTLTQAGAVHVYSRSGSTWTLQQTLRASDETSYWRFGRHVKFNSDGTYLIVGAPMSNASAGNGAAYVFTRSGSTWTQQAKLTASDAELNDFFGTSVSMNSDATYAIIGAEQEDGGAGNPIVNSGAAYVFTRSGSTWTQQAKLVSSDAQGNDFFGASVSITDDGSYAAVSANGEDGGAGDPEPAAGAAYIFERDGSTWTEIKKLTASDAQTSDQFGAFACNISGDGSYVIVGAYGEDGGAGDPLSLAGAAYIYEAG